MWACLNLDAGPRNATEPAGERRAGHRAGPHPRERAGTRERRGAAGQAGAEREPLRPHPRRVPSSEGSRDEFGGFCERFLYFLLTKGRRELLDQNRRSHERQGCQSILAKNSP